MEEEPGREKVLRGVGNQRKVKKKKKAKKKVSKRKWSVMLGVAY